MAQPTKSRHAQYTGPFAIPASARSQPMRDNIEVTKGDLLRQTVDAIIVPVNNDLLLNVGLAGRVAKRGGPGMQRECNRIGKIDLGSAAIVKGGKLKAKWVALAACYTHDQPIVEEALILSIRHALTAAREKKVASIAIPRFGGAETTFPLKRCAEQMISEVLRSTEKDTTLDRVVFVLDDEVTFLTFQDCLKQI